MEIWGVTLWSRGVIYEARSTSLFDIYRRESSSEHETIMHEINDRQDAVPFGKNHWRNRP